MAIPKPKPKPPIPDPLPEPIPQPVPEPPPDPAPPTPMPPPQSSHRDKTWGARAPNLTAGRVISSLSRHAAPRGANGNDSPFPDSSGVTPDARGDWSARAREAAQQS